MAVNSRSYDSDALKQAIKSAAGNGRSVELLIKAGDLYRSITSIGTAAFAIHGWRRSERAGHTRRVAGATLIETDGGAQCVDWFSSRSAWVCQVSPRGKRQCGQHRMPCSSERLRCTRAASTTQRIDPQLVR